MKRPIYLLIISLVVVSGLVFADRRNNNDPVKRSNPKPTSASAAAFTSELKKWEATPEGIKYKKWEASPAGVKVLTNAAKLKKHTNAFTNMEAVVTSLDLPAGSRLGFGVMVKINGDDHILVFNAEKESELKAVRTLKVNDKIIIRSRTVSHAPKYAFPIVSGDEIDHNGKMIYKRVIRKGGC